MNYTLKDANIEKTCVEATLINIIGNETNRSSVFTPSEIEIIIKQNKITATTVNYNKEGIPLP